MLKFLTPVLVSLCSLALAAIGRRLLRAVRELLSEMRTTRAEIKRLPDHAATIAVHSARLDGIDVQVFRLSEDVADLKAGFEGLRDQLVALILPTRVPQEMSSNEP